MFKVSKQEESTETNIQIHEQKFKKILDSFLVTYPELKKYKFQLDYNNIYNFFEKLQELIKK